MIWVYHRGVTYLYNVSWLPPMQISSGGIGNGLYQEGRDGGETSAGCISWKIHLPTLRTFLSTFNGETRVFWVHQLSTCAFNRSLSLSVFNCPLEITPPVKRTVSERVLATVILPGRPVFGEKLAKGCDCDDGAAAEERRCNILPECRILQKLHFAACQLRWQQPLSRPIAR